MYYLYIMEFYLAIKNYESVNWAGKRMKMENILNEVTQT